MFTPADRERVRTAVIERARDDQRISGGAMTGSASVGKEDKWSDIDLAFGVSEGFALADVLKDYTKLMYDHCGAIHHVDVFSGSWIYRVFFLTNTLQVDVAFAPAKDFGAKAPTFKLLFGSAAELSSPANADVESMIGYAWLYAIHVRSCIERNKFWQAELMLSGMRERILAIACLRHGLSTKEGRGFDQLPAEVLDPLRGSYVASLNAQSLRAAFVCVTERLICEIHIYSPELAKQLTPALRELNQPAD